MADNVNLTAGDGTIIAGSDLIGGVSYPRVKLIQGADGVNSGDTSTANPFPVQLRKSDGTDVSGTLPVSIASGGVASGAIASGAVASGAIASGAVASGAIASGALASGSIAAGAVAAGATSIADNEDAASADGDRGVKMLAVRKATPANTSGTDGDYEFLQMSAGRLWTDSNVKIGGTAPDLGVGTGGSVTQRVAVDSSQIPTAGAQATSASVPVNLATDAKYFANAYETVAASQTAQALGASGATGDWVSHLVVIPATTSPGNVLLLDNATSITVFTGGASSVATLHPFTIDLRMVSVSGAWKVTTGTNVSVIGVGKFT